MSQPLRVLYVHNSADLYGASRAMLRVASRLDRARFAPLVALPEEGPLLRELDAAAIPHVIVPSIRCVTRSLKSPGALLRWLAGFPGSVLALRALIRERGIGLVHTNTAIIVSSPLAARLAGVPHVWHVREFFDDFPRLWPAYARFMRAFSAGIVAISRAVAGQFRGSPPPAVIYDGYDAAAWEAKVDEDAASFRLRHGLDDAFVVGCFGRIKLGRKGQDFLVEAARVLKQRGLDLRYLLVGAVHPDNRDHLPRLHALIAAADLGREFVFTGELENPAPACAAVDLLVLPSCMPEPLGNVVLEAMALRRPVIVTALGGAPEMIEEGVTGFAVPARDAAVFADRIETLFRDRELARRMGAAGRERLDLRFSLEKNVAEIEALYEALSEVSSEAVRARGASPS